jgi:acetyl esterase/lipase
MRIGAFAITGLNPPYPVQRFAYELSSLAVRPPSGTTHRTTTIAGVRCETVTARDARTDRIVVHLHGGGFCIGSPRGHRAFAGWLSRATGCTVIVPDYRLAPEQP